MFFNLFLKIMSCASRSKKLVFSMVLAVLALVLAPVAKAAAPWHASPNGVQIASGLMAYNTTADGFEASGIEYIPGYGYILIGDDGDIGVVNSNGAVLHYWFPGGDLEDVALTETSAVDHIIYIANEAGSKIEAFNLDTGTKVANKSWTLSDLPVSGALGMESLAYVPAADAPASWGTALSGGFFVTASQAEAVLRVYNINTHSNGATVSSIAQIPVSYTDVAALQYSPLTRLLYVVFDTDDKLKEYTLTGAIVNSYQLPTTGNSDEGMIVIPDCANSRAQIAISNDAASSFVLVYNNYPITCPVTTPPVIDADNDGYLSTADCNDADATVHSNQTYYRDEDGDGLGDATVTISVCSSSAPSGYVTNSSDANDHDHDNDGVITGVDCNDNDPTISANQIYYADIDHDGLGDPNNTIAVCSYTPPAGYVTNHDDIRDQPVAAIPDVPTNLLFSLFSSRLMQLSWNGVGDYYTVRLTDLSNNKTTIFDKITQTNKVVDISAKHSYVFSVRACNIYGCSKYSDWKSFSVYSAQQLRALKLLFKK